MSTIKETLDHARSEVQELHKQVEASAAKEYDVIKADLVSAGAKAEQLAHSLTTVAEDHGSKAKQHIVDAVAQLEDAAQGTRELASASVTELKHQNTALLTKVHVALHSISQAVAARRSSSVTK